MITKDLGLVTAYAYAVAGGYTGTEAEFTELLGNIAKDLEEIEDLSVTVETLPPGSGAAASYADGVLHLGIPRGDKGEKGDKGDKGDKGETGETGPQGPKGDPGDVSTEQLDEAISGVRAEMEESCARNDGYYEEMTVGDAEQLISTQFVEDTDPYLFRPTGGSADVGNREYLEKIVGGTVAWNQLAEIVGYQSPLNGVTFTINSDGSVTVNGTASSNARWSGFKAPAISGHVYYSQGCPSGGSNSTYRLYSSYMGDTLDRGSGRVVKNTNSTSYPYATGEIFISSGYTANNLVFKPQYIDLTAMFGSTIADYIYSLEQATAGAGVAWFRNYFPNDYYPYDPGTLRSVEGVSAHETVGFNQFDKSTAIDGKKMSVAAGVPVENNTWAMSDYIKVVPNMNYYTNADGTGQDYVVTLFDANKEYIGNRPIATGVFNTGDARYVVVSTIKARTSIDNLMVNLSDPTRNGEYEPYTKHTYPLDSSLTLMGVPKLVDGKLAFDGDVYPPSGEVQRRYGVVDLGTLNFNYDSSGQRWQVQFPSVKSFATRSADLVSDKWVADTTASAGSNGKMFTVGKGLYLYSTDSVNAPTGTLIYPLATPTTEAAEGYEHYQMCDTSGTEAFVTDSIVLVGHETRYPANLRDKLQHLPDLPSPLIDGAYMVMVSGSQMHIEKFLIPDAPTEDGTYTLKATVSDGTPTYTWEVEE